MLLGTPEQQDGGGGAACLGVSDSGTASEVVGRHELALE